MAPTGIDGSHRCTVASKIIMKPDRVKIERSYCLETPLCVTCSITDQTLALCDLNSIPHAEGVQNHSTPRSAV